MAKLSRATGHSWKFTNRKPQSKRQVQREFIQREVIKFIEREDNSVTLPGKPAALTVDNKKLQKHILSDYLHTLHQKFLFENPVIKISRALCGRLCPRHILPVNFGHRQTCLCSRHQNMALMLRGLITNKVSCTKKTQMFSSNNMTSLTIILMWAMLHIWSGKLSSLLRASDGSKSNVT